MRASERIFHAILFELGAVLSTLVLTSVTTNHESRELGIVIVLISLIAMAWNVVFNWFFDKIFSGERLKRGFGLRLLHTLSFEGGLLLFTIPLIVFVLNIGWWEAFIMDIGMTLFILAYSILFNWVYDYIRYQITHSKK